MSRQKFVLEKRHADGSLDFSLPQPPFITATEHQIWHYFYKKNPDVPNSTLAQAYAWYKEQGFEIRPKTW